MATTDEQPSIAGLVELTRGQVEAHYPEAPGRVGFHDQWAAELRKQAGSWPDIDGDDPAFWAGVLFGVHYTGMSVQRLLQAHRERGLVPTQSSLLRTLVDADAVAAVIVEGTRTTAGEPTA